MAVVIFVPGLLCSPRLWHAQVEALAAEHEVVVFDHRRDDDFASMAERLLDEVQGRFALAGLSMGGYLAQEVAIRAPDRVERLALACTRALPDTEDGRARRMRQVGQAEAGGFRHISAQLGEAWLSEGHRTEANVALMADMAAWVGIEAFRLQQTAIAGRRDMRPHLPGIGCPTLILCGRLDRTTPADGHVEMAEAIPGADLVVLGDCGHLAPLERPTTVTAALRSWLDRPLN